MKQVKIIQSRLSSRKVSVSYAQIREYLQNFLPDKEEFSEDEVTEIVNRIYDDFSESSLAIVDNKANITVPKQQVADIKNTAKNMSVKLSLEDVKQIATSIDRVGKSRSEITAKIRSAITAYIDFQVSRDNKDLEFVISEAEQLLVDGLNENNQRFAASAQDFSRRVDESIKSFRTTETEILDLFKIPN